MKVEGGDRNTQGSVAGLAPSSGGSFLVGQGIPGVLETTAELSPSTYISGAGGNPRVFFPLSEEVLRAREELDPQEVVSELNQAFRRLSKQIVGRQDVLEQTRLALLTRSHQLLDGPPGTGKSLLAASVFCQFSEQSTFPVQLHPDTTPEHLFGAIDLHKLKLGKIFHNTANSLVRANFAYFDELFRANRGVLQTLLGIVHERWFMRGQQLEPSPLHSAIATTNFQRRNPELQALLDRFPFRARMENITDPLLLSRIDRAHSRGRGYPVPPSESTSIPMWKLGFLTDIVEDRVPTHQVIIPRHVLFLKNHLVQRYVDSVKSFAHTDLHLEESISNRTTAFASRILNAATLIRGGTRASVDDLIDLRHVLVPAGVDGSERAAFDTALLEVRKDVNQRDERNIDTLLELDDLADQVIEAFMSKGEALVPSGNGLAPLEQTLIEKLMTFFRISSIGELSIGRMKAMANSVRPESPIVKSLQSRIIEELDNSRKTLNRAETAPLL